MGLIKSIIAIFTILILSACQTEASLIDARFDPTEVLLSEEGTLPELKVKLLYTDGSSEEVPLDLAWLTSPSVDALATHGTHQITLTIEEQSFASTLFVEASELHTFLRLLYDEGLLDTLHVSSFSTWLEQLRGEPGRSIQDALINDQGELVLRFDDASTLVVGRVLGQDAPIPIFEIRNQQLAVQTQPQGTWQNLLDLSSLEGRGILDLRLDEASDLIVTYTDLSTENLGNFSSFIDTLAIASVTLEQGELVLTLTDGRRFNVGNVVGPIGPQGPLGPQGPQGLQGADGSDVEFRVFEGWLESKYTHESVASWRPLFNLSTLQGESGPQGPAGDQLVLSQSEDQLWWRYASEDDAQRRVLLDMTAFQGPTGPGITIRYNDALLTLEYRYSDDEPWESLVSLEDFTGAQGLPGLNVLLKVENNHIVWALDEENPTFESLVNLEDLRAPTPEFAVDEDAIVWRVGEGDWQTLVSLSALQGPIGPQGRSIQSVTLEGQSFIIRYDDGIEETIGTWPIVHPVIFRLANGAVLDVQYVLSGSSIQEPSHLALPFGVTLAGFSPALGVVSEHTSITVLTTPLSFEITFENTTLPSQIVLGNARLVLPEVEAPEGYDFKGFVHLRGANQVPIYEGFPLDILFDTTPQVTLIATFERTVRFHNQTEEDLIAMLEEAAQAAVFVGNFGTSGNSLGSGVIYRRETLEEGYRYFVATNEHVTNGHNTLQVRYYLFGNEFIIDQENIVFLGADAKNDVAVLRFDAPHLLEPLVFGNSLTIQTGQVVYSLGNPLDPRYFGSVTQGMLIQHKRLMTHPGSTNSYFIQHDALINPGNSGGPLISSNGEILGLNTLRIEATGDRAVHGMGFAIPSHIIERVIADIEAVTSLNRGTFGATLAQVNLCDDTATFGVCVQTVSPPGTAKTLGLQEGDIIIGFQHARMVNFAPIANLSLFQEALFGTRLQEDIRVIVLRDGQALQTEWQPLKP